MLVWFTALFSLPGLAQPLWPPQTFSAYYGEIEADTPQKLADFDLLILHPGDDNKNLSPDKLAQLRGTGKPKTLVGYVSIGEDDHPPGGPPLQNQDATGPCYVGKDLTKALAHNGYPGYFMDQRQQLFDKNGFLKFDPNGKPALQGGQDGHPDENGVWGSYYVNAADPVWRAKVFKKLELVDQLGLDGFFLDTVDTASPWGNYGWTAVGMLELVEQIRARYPNKRIVANRGLWYLAQDDRFARAIDAVLFESLLTMYREETRSAGISPWARWEVQALWNDVIPAQKKTGLALLVLDYLDPEHADVPLLVQSARTLLQAVPQYSLSFSHPSLRVPGWTGDSLLNEAAPSAWPTITGIKLLKEELGTFTVEVAFDSVIPAGVIPDLRVTTRDDIVPERAAELPLARVRNFQPKGTKALVTSDGLNKATTYQLYFRLISKSPTPQTPFAWTSITTPPSDLPGQVADLSSESNAEGLLLKFSSVPQASRYRVYRLSSKGAPDLLTETGAPPVLLSQAPIDGAAELMVVAVDRSGLEGYPSQSHVAVRRNVVPTRPPGQVTITEEQGLTVFRWSEVANAVSYRLYAIPEAQSFRLPLVCDGPEATVEGAVPGSYRVFATTVDKDGNQSQPGPVATWVVK